MSQYIPPDETVELISARKVAAHDASVDGDDMLRAWCGLRCDPEVNASHVGASGRVNPHAPDRDVRADQFEAGLLGNVVPEQAPIRAGIDEQPAPDLRWYRLSCCSQGIGVCRSDPNVRRDIGTRDEQGPRPELELHHGRFLLNRPLALFERLLLAPLLGVAHLR